MTIYNEKYVLQINFVQIQVNTEAPSSILNLYTVMHDILCACKKAIPLAHSKINRVREKVIYNELIEFELDRKHRLDTGIFFII